MKNVKVFKDYKAYEAVMDKDYDSHENYGKVYILDEASRIEAEARFEMKSARCAVKNFFRIIPDEMKGFHSGFEEELLDAIDNGRFSDYWRSDGFGKSYWVGWNVVADCWDGGLVYISLRMSKDTYNFSGKLLDGMVIE